MCGRYTHLLTWEKIVNLYWLTLPEEEPKGLAPNYIVAPTHVMPIIRPAGNGRERVMAIWGLVPFWLKPQELGKQPYSTINARADRIQTAPTYREPFKKRRCLVPRGRDDEALHRRDRDLGGRRRRGQREEQPAGAHGAGGVCCSRRNSRGCVGSVG